MSDSGEMDIQAHFPIPWMTDSPETDILAYAFLPCMTDSGESDTRRVKPEEHDPRRQPRDPGNPATRQPDKRGSPHLAH